MLREAKHQFWWSDRLPFDAFLFEGAAIFTAAAEYIGDLRDETSEHGLQQDQQLRCLSTSTRIANEQHDSGFRDINLPNIPHLTETIQLSVK